ncbi:hypothetical protein K502DRAFT_342274 [Neoconidiobolus thromboides FSU 785]|nr:hypothetical protein K502DRAFT_342274 [Neoconidiobolus thromboides FSU 785]
MRFNSIQFYSYLILFICLCSISINAAPADDNSKNANNNSDEEPGANVIFGQCVDKCDPRDTSCKAKCSGSSDLAAGGIKDTNNCIAACYTNKDFIGDSTKTSQCVKNCSAGTPQVNGNSVNGNSSNGSSASASNSASNSASGTGDKSKATQSKASPTSGALFGMAFTANTYALYAISSLSLFYLTV